RDLDGLAVLKEDVDQPKAAADDPGVREQAADFVRPGVRADVEILRLAAEHQVAHAAADEVGFIARAVQPVENLQGLTADLLPGDRVLGPRKNTRLHLAGYAHAVIIPKEGPGRVEGPAPAGGGRREEGWCSGTCLVVRTSRGMPAVMPATLMPTVMA